VFQLARQYLDKLGYDGPVGLSCDDTKLKASLRTYWDPERKQYLLVGGVGEPRAVANMDEMRQLLENGAPEKATKVIIPPRSSRSNGAL
jgi:hypothetical protein